MEAHQRTQPVCFKCNRETITSTGDGCYNGCSINHETNHPEQLPKSVDDMLKQLLGFSLEIDKEEERIRSEINRWESESIRNIQSMAETKRASLRNNVYELNNRLISLKASIPAHSFRKQNGQNTNEIYLQNFKIQIKNLINDLMKLSNVDLPGSNKNTFHSTRLESQDKEQFPIPIRHPPNHNPQRNQLTRTNSVFAPSQASSVSNTSRLFRANEKTLHRSYERNYLQFGVDDTTNRDILRLFDKLMSFEPMSPNGPMSGRCEKQTDQMERFLAQNFGFQNIPGEEIVPGVKSFFLKKSLHTIHPDTKIYFPFKHPNSFVMSIREILEWQRSYRVYADKDIPGMSKEFLQRALQGRSNDGEEAFRMKFVIRMSTCPILMEFDAKVIPRDLNDTWPHRIKLVSVTGIDFAGRKHDVADILYYVSNWRDVYEIDLIKNQLVLANERDFLIKRGKKGRLNEDRLLKDLMRMARLRFCACDAEGVEIVVETGIGLGVFAGHSIEVDNVVRVTSALAVKTVLEEDGSKYKNIRAVIFSLPVFDVDESERSRDTFSSFYDQFREPMYNGNIPVLIADQDMHRLTVAIARMGFIVSELNPADSHGVFGEYWQNRGPAVEEKLALTTVGLLVQHHLINPHISDFKNYILL